MVQQILHFWMPLVLLHTSEREEAELMQKVDSMEIDVASLLKKRDDEEWHHPRLTLTTRMDPGYVIHKVLKFSHTPIHTTSIGKPPP